jgi:Xaa-Pro aminopeptidase
MSRRALLLFFVVVAAGAPALAHPPSGMPPVARVTPPRAPTSFSDGAVRLDEIQGQLAIDRLDGWLLTDYRGQDEAALDLVRPHGVVSRRWFYLIPATGEPVVLYHAAEGQAFDLVPGRKSSYESWKELDGKLRELVKGRKKIAVAWSPKAAVPSLSRIDGGTLEQLRATSVQLVPSGDLVTRFCARWSEPQRAAHLFAVHQLSAIKDEAWKTITDAATQHTRLTEWDLEEQLARALATHGLESELPPQVAFGAHTADPGYHPNSKESAELRAGELVTIALAARQTGPSRAVYADGAWVAYVGDAIPAPAAAAFSTVKAARDAAVALIRERAGKKSPLHGYEVDAAARAILDKEGHGKARHATGHSLGDRPLGDGPDLDDLETHDERLLLPRTGYSVAPGLYLAGEIGMRSGVDLFLGDAGVEVTVEKPQESIDLLRPTAGAQPAPVPVSSAKPAPKLTPVAAPAVAPKAPEPPKPAK